LRGISATAELLVTLVRDIFHILMVLLFYLYGYLKNNVERLAVSSRHLSFLFDIINNVALGPCPAKRQDKTIYPILLHTFRSLHDFSFNLINQQSTTLFTIQ